MRKAALALAGYRQKSTEVLDRANILCSLARGTITEVLGEQSTGRSSLALGMLATATQAGEVVAFIDCHDSFDPISAQTSGVKLGKLLWVQCAHQVDAAIKAADMILHSGGFKLIVLDLCDAPARDLNRIPTSCWYRFQRAIEHTPSVLLVLADQSLARACASRQIALQKRHLHWRGDPPFQTIERLDIEAASRKPISASAIELEAWAEV